MLITRCRLTLVPQRIPVIYETAGRPGPDEQRLNNVDLGLQRQNIHQGAGLGTVAHGSIAVRRHRGPPSSSLPTSSFKVHRNNKHCARQLQLRAAVHIVSAVAVTDGALCPARCRRNGPAYERLCRLEVCA